ncbi:MAG: hypothetical protein EAZ73_05460 [Oscillatoriales cyanobacterium]|nr:MAG: hypothetical protein EAZ83_05845 [Oscillatoriales cyanobacterium]TAF22504.1 MAG: hypothetical protein EAZ73_05460 [Oscillatoriales cyanobacterium]
MFFLSCINAKKEQDTSQNLPQHFLCRCRGAGKSALLYFASQLLRQVFFEQASGFAVAQEKRIVCRKFQEKAFYR